MIAKYDDNGGRIHDDHCFNFINPTMEENIIEDNWNKKKMKSILISV
jgi:hypothetical protein